jgi:hypothetical protein
LQSALRQRKTKACRMRKVAGGRACRPDERVSTLLPLPSRARRGPGRRAAWGRASCR